MSATHDLSPVSSGQYRLPLSEIEAKQANDGADPPFGLMQSQVEHGTQRQRRRYRVVLGSARQAAIASSVNRTIKLHAGAAQHYIRPVRHPMPLPGMW
jgi:hypothetical protein